MKDEKIYGPRIDWYGGECPVPQNTLVKVKYRDGTFRSGFTAAAYCWFHDGVDGDIVEYCTIIEQSDLYAAATVWRKHLRGQPAPTQADSAPGDEAQRGV